MIYVKKKWLATVIIIIGIVTGLLPNFMYYSSRIDAIKKASIHIDQLKLEVTSTKVGNQHATLYISKQNELTIVWYNVRNKNGKVQYKVDSTMIFYQDIDTITFEKLNRRKKFFMKNKFIDNGIMLLGIKSDINAYEMKVNEITPVVNEFDLDGKRYYLWYIIGGEEIDSITEQDIL